MIKQYELSIWDDTTLDNGDFEEQKIATIGGSEYRGKEHAYKIVEERMVNGDRRLTFNMLSRIPDEDGNLIVNPYSAMLVNERKIKIRDGAPYPVNEDFSSLNEKDTKRKWRTYVIKYISEPSSNYVVTYMAKELYVNELGKNGFSTLLNAELNNNYGTLQELSERVLEGSGWKTVVEGQAITEKRPMPLFKMQLSAELAVTGAFSKTAKTLQAGTIIYPFYQCFKRDNTSGAWVIDKSVKFQFIYNEENMYSLDDNRLIVDEDSSFNYFSDYPQYSSLQLTGDIGSEPMQGNYLVESQPMHYEHDLERYVHTYKVKDAKSGAAVGSIAYGYPETIYNISDIIENTLTNHQNFVNNIAWNTLILDNVKPISLPIPTSNNINTWDDIDITNYLSLSLGSANTVIRNEGPSHARMSLVKDNYYVLRVKGRMIRKGVDNYGGGGSNISITNQPSIKASIVKQDGTSYVSVTNAVKITNAAQYLDSSTDTKKRGYVKTASTRVAPGGGYGPHADEQQYVYVYLKASESTNAVLDKLHLNLINTETNTTYDYCIEDIQLFDFASDKDGKPIFPGDLPSADILTRTIYYNRNSDNQIITLAQDDSYYEPIKRDDYAAARSIDVQESNYFNNTAALAEMFEVWVSYNVTHTQDGHIWTDPTTGEPEKIVYFSQFAPTDLPYNQAGFKYGVNLNSIVREIDSSQLTTKVIVKANSQEFATDGSTSITRSRENPSGENEIYNFNYYINQGLLTLNQVLADLYGFTSKDFGFYSKMRSLNDGYDVKSKTLVTDQRKVNEIKANIEYYELGINSTKEQIDYQNFFLTNLPDDEKRKVKYKVATATLVAQKKKFEQELEKQKQLKDYYEKRIKSGQEEIDNILEQKKSLKEQFYAKYSRFIQEGMWTDDTYVDDDLYYIDASKIASTSAFPQTSYTIDVVDLSDIEGYEGFKFNIGCKTYIEDTEFFGYVYKDVPGAGRAKTPYRMEAIVVQQSYSYDDPSQNRLVIQTYKNQYQDVFQQLVTTTNELQYKTGNLSLIASQFTESGEIKPQALEKVFSKNALTLAGSGLQEVNFDDGRGIEVTSKENTAFQLRIIGEGIYMTSDGGRNWTSAVTPLGINTRLLQAGQIDTSRINILSGGLTSFRWDENGISAYKTTDEQYSVSDFVRMNQYGIFGTTNGLDLEVAIEGADTFNDKVAAVKKYSNWALTWDGLDIKAQEGSVSLTPLGGLEVFNPDIYFPQDTVDNYDGIILPDNSRNYTTEDLVPIVGLGRYFRERGDLRYGLAMRNYEGIFTLVTDQNGNLNLANTLTVGALNGLADNVDGADKYYRYLVIDGAPRVKTQDENGNPVFEDISERPVMYAGGIDPLTAPFRLYGDGHVYGENFDIKGFVEATGGIFSGDILIGKTSGISGFDSETGTPYAFWAGKYEDNDPLLWIGHDGEIHAERAIINGEGTFTGDIYAENGYFNGIINAFGGRIQDKLNFGLSDNTYIGNTEDNDTVFNIEDNFYIDKYGNTYGNALYLVKNLNWNDDIAAHNYNIVVGASENPAYIFQAYDSSKDKQGQIVFGIKEDGSVDIEGILNLNGILNADSGISFNGQIKSMGGGFVIDGTTGSITNNQSSVNGWGIYGDGSAFFDNVTVRGEITSTVFKKDYVSGMGGTLLVSPSVMIEETIQGADNTFELPLVLFSGAWHDNNRVIINHADGTTENSILKKVNNNYTIYSSKSVLEKGTQIISTDNTHNLIELNAEHRDGGYIRIAGKLNENETKTTLLGNLADELIPPLGREYFGTNLGTGLFSDNAYLMGRMYLPSAGITDEHDKHKYPFDADIASYDKTGAEIRFWAGSSAEDREKAPFIVTQDGSIYATQGEFQGRVVAHNSIFSGMLDGVGALIDKPFYFIEKNKYDENSPDNIKNNILRIEKDGIYISKGFNIESATQESNLYNKNITEDAWKVLSFIDEGEKSRLSTTAIHVLGLDQELAAMYSIYTSPQSIKFTYLDSLVNDNYESVEQILANSNPTYEFGYVDGEFGLYGDRISLGRREKPAIEISTEDDKNIVDFEGDFANSCFRVSSTGTDMYFTYIGE